ncbi:hypothetical protein GCM10020295_75350 [Streptomyces cinereospinus]
MKPTRRLSGAVAVLVSGVLAAVLALTSAPTAQAGQTALRAADPSVLRVGGTYVSVQSTGGGIAVRQAPSTAALASAPARQVWSDTGNLGEVWAPEIVRDGGRYYIYFSAGAPGPPDVRHQLRRPGQRLHGRHEAGPAGRQVGHRRHPVHLQRAALVRLVRLGR